MITTEVVDFDLAGKCAYSDGELLFNHEDSILSVFKVVETNGTTKFEQVATVKLDSHEELYGFERGIAKVRSPFGSR